MHKRLWVIVFCMLLLAIPGVLSYWCYQETANVSTSCGGLSTGNYEWQRLSNFSTSYSVNNSFDGNWNTYSFLKSSPDKNYANLTINYTIPSFTNNLLFQLKTDTLGINMRNYTLPTNCTNESIVSLRYTLSQEGGVAPTGSFSLYCFDFSGNKYFRFDSYGSDGTGYFYEEGIWWNMSLNMDDCSDYDYLLLNYSILDEDTKLPITGLNESIKVTAKIYSYNNNPILLTNYSNMFGGTNATLCLKDYPTNSKFYLYTTVEYSADGYVHEYDYIQKYLLDFSTFTPIHTNLYDLVSSKSTSFIIKFKNNVFLPVSSAIIEILRLYTEQGEYKSVEDALTDEDGQTVGHFVEEDVTYKFIIKKEGIILATFNDRLVTCQEVPCQINLNQFDSITSPTDFSSYDNLGYSVDLNESGRNITISFATLDSSESIMNLVVIKDDHWSNETICDNTVTSSSGTLRCNVPTTYGNSTVKLVLYKDGEFVTSRYYNFQPRGFSMFGYTGYFLAAWMVILLPFMSITSPVGAIVLSILGVFIAGVIMLISINKVFAVGSALLWFIIAGGILIYKITKRE